jgi:prepilin-type N-terminal cleavage/methylation domain-containing protein
MTKIQQQKGFTLVELAIVMVIIGLLIGGILKGQELIQNARVTATMAQVQAIKAATIAFQDRYNGLPGDFKGVGVIPGCAGSGPCDFATGTPERNGIIGDPSWNMIVRQGSGGGLYNPPSTVADSEANQPGLFWFYLFASNMLGGGYSTAPIAGAPIAGKSHLAGKLGHSYVIGYTAGTQPGQRTPTGGLPVTITGTVLSLVKDLAAPDVGGAFAFKANIAATLDRKDDDGNPFTGHVQGFGDLDCETSSAWTPATSTYDEGGAGFHCGLYWGDIWG